MCYSLSPEEIAEKTDHLTGMANIRAINREFRAQDESHLWPVDGRFNATEREIRQAREFRRLSGGSVYGLEYCYLLDELLSSIVNA